MTEAAGPLTHHFDTLQQQRDASRQGMWIFLATELLFFGGLSAPTPSTGRTTPKSSSGRTRFSTSRSGR